VPQQRGVRVVGWSDPEGSRHRIGSLLLGYYSRRIPRFIYAGRVGTGMTVAKAERVWHRYGPLSVAKMPLSEPPRAEPVWITAAIVEGALVGRDVVEVSYVEMTPDGLLRHVVYLG